jgi:hypothetical protein
VVPEALLERGEHGVRPVGEGRYVLTLPWTERIFVGDGDEPCVVVGVGTRRKGRGIVYPRSETTLAHGAGVEEATEDPRVAYARFAEDVPVGSSEVFPL